MRPLFSSKSPLVKYYNSRLSVVFESILIGFAAGILVVGFRMAISFADTYREALYRVLRASALPWLPLWAAGLGLLGVLLGLCAKKWPMIRGSGIPQIEGALHKGMPLKVLPELPLKMLSGVLGLGAGLSLGREGPSIQIGAYTGKGILRILRRPSLERRILITSASAAGLSAAFNAPLAGLIFVLEELGAGFSPLFLACAMAASMAADATAGWFFGLAPVFDFSLVQEMPIRAYPWVVALGILCALSGDLFKRAIYAFQDLYAKSRIPMLLRPCLPLLVSIPLGLFLADALGGGHALIERLPSADFSLGWIVLLFAVKLIFTALCYGSGTAGGIFLPLLSCGALVGAGLGMQLEQWGLLAEGQRLNMLILGMAAFFAAVVRAPVCGIVLILEMSGSFTHLASLVLASLSAFITAELIRSKPVYMVLLERMTAKTVSRGGREAA
ncbi:MAG: ClC family H(+)/Cl(-) exchange transporter [Treponema sp.]|jgi:H+/Cl- antiporter ClcA|nr:ClC family H(+)/Cl(-) exchange transporter [Treponema sp.]